jgi:uncharacterized protein (DUF4415 family)
MKLTRKIANELDAIARMPDEEIDLSDDAETTNGKGGVRGRFYRPIKRPVTMRLDADLLAWLKAQGKGYQTRVNELLRAQMMKERKRRKSA